MKRMFCMLLVLVLFFSLGGSALADDVLFCRICGRQIPVDSRVCPYCGEAVVLIEQGTQASVQGSEPAAQSGAPLPAAQAEAGPFNKSGGAFGGGKVYVTKSPTSESVPYGGSCAFIAHAANAASVTWYIANGDASVVAPAAEAPGFVSGLSVSGYNTDTLVFSGIPSWLNGCQVQACFTGEGGPVYSEPARIWTYEAVQDEEPSCQWGWHPFFPWDPYWEFPFCPHPWSLSELEEHPWPPSCPFRSDELVD